MDQHINAKQELLMQSLTKFFTQTKNYEKLLLILNKKSRVSLRVIDWFVTNFSKDISYHNPLNNQPFMIYDHYKSQLRAYSKKQFDPFCRRTRIQFYYTPTQKIVTTVGQLNFFRWCIENGVVDFVESHFESIEASMKDYTRTFKETKRMSKKKKEDPTVSQKSHRANSGGTTKRNMSKTNFYVTICFE